MKLLKKFKLPLQLIIVGTIFYFMWRVVYSNWDDISLENIDINVYKLTGSFFILIIYFLYLVKIWQIILKYMNINLEFVNGMKIFFYSLLGKYLPGKVWLIAGKVYLSQKHGISKKKVVFSSFIEIFANMLSGLFLFLIAILFEENFQTTPNLTLVILLLVPILLLLLNPKLLVYFINLGLKLFGRETLKIDFTFYQIASIFCYSFFAWLIIGTGFYFMINSFVYISYTKIPILAGSISLAGTIGLLSIFVPAGIGIREGILALLLSNILSSHMAVLSSLMCRVWLTTGEVVMLIVAYNLRPPTKHIDENINQ